MVRANRGISAGRSVSRDIGPALYLHHSTGGKGGAYTVTPGRYTEKLMVSPADRELPSGLG